MKLHQTFFALAPAMMVLTIVAAPALAQEPASRSTSQQSQAGVANATLTDGQILQIVRTLNDGEIKQANEAVDESDSPEVKQVAQMIITDHESSNELMDDLLSGDLDLDDSPMNQKLEADAEKTHEQLQDLSDTQYDCSYLQKQVAQHETAISTAKNQLLPNAKNADVKEFLTAMGPKLEHHLEMAKASLGKATGCQ